MVLPLQDIGRVNPVDIIGATKSAASVNLARTRNELFDLKTKDFAAGQPLRDQSRASQLERQQQQREFDQANIAASLFDNGLDDQALTFIAQTGDPEAQELIQMFTGGNPVQQQAIKDQFSKQRQAGIGAGFLNGPTPEEFTTVNVNERVLNSAGEVILGARPETAPTTTRTLTPEEIETAGFPVGTVAQVDSSGKFSNINIPKGDSAIGVRTLTTEEITNSGLPEGTFAQVDDNGKFLNIEIPSTGSGQNFRTLLPEEVKAANLPPGTFAQIGEDGKFVNIKLPQDTNATRTLNPEEVAALGLPEGTVAQQATGGKVTTVFNPPPPAEQFTDVPADDLIARGFLPGTTAQQGDGGKLVNILRPTDRQQAIANLQAQGKTPTEAANLFDENVDVDFNPKTGKVTLINKLTPSFSEVPSRTKQVPIPKPPPNQTLWDLAPAATGLISGLSATAGRAAGIVGLSVGGDAIKAQQQIKVATRELIRSLVVGDRITATEIGIIEKEIDLGAGTFTGLPVLRAKMRAINDSLTVRMQQAERDFGDDSLDEETRQKQGQNANFIRNFLVTLGVPSVGAEAQSLDNQAAAIRAEMEKRRLKRGEENQGITERLDLNQ